MVTLESFKCHDGKIMYESCQNCREEIIFQKISEKNIFSSKMTEQRIVATGRLTGTSPLSQRVTESGPESHKFGIEDNFTDGNIFSLSNIKENQENE